MMKKILLLALSSFFLVSAQISYSQDNDNSTSQNPNSTLNCYEVYKKAFAERGSYSISDNMYRNIMIVFFNEDGSVNCIRGKVRVKGGYITSIFYYYKDNSSKLYDKKFHNLKNEPPSVTNGISDMIVNGDRQKLRIVFVDQLKSRQKQLQQMPIPKGLLGN